MTAFLVDRVAQESAPLLVPGQAGRVDEQGLAVAAQPDDPPGRLIVGSILANHANPGFGIPNIAIEVYLSITKANALHGTQPLNRPNGRFFQDRVGFQLRSGAVERAVRPVQ